MSPRDHTRSPFGPVQLWGYHHHTLVMPRPPRWRRWLRKLTSPMVIAAMPLAIIPVGLAAPARADGVLSYSELAYASQYGAGAICPVIDEYPSIAGVRGVLDGIAEDGYSYDSAVDIINYSVATYCPRNWSLLVAIGRAARSTQSAATAAPTPAAPTTTLPTKIGGRIG